MPQWRIQDGAFRAIAPLPFCGGASWIKILSFMSGQDQFIKLMEIIANSPETKVYLAVKLSPIVMC